MKNLTNLLTLKRSAVVAFVSALLLLASFNQKLSASEYDKISNQLSEKIKSVNNNEFIRINITLTEQFETQELIARVEGMDKNDRRIYVVSALKDFSKNSQKGVIVQLKDMQRNKMVKNLTTYWIANVINCYATPATIMELNKRKDIKEIDYDEYRLLLDPAERKNAFPEKGFNGSREITWNVLKINADDVWMLGFDGDGVIVSVIDTGVNYDHEDLQDHLWESDDYPNHGYDFANNDNDPMDDDGHGTHCAGTVAGDGTAGSQTGVAPGASIMCMKVLDANGSGYESSVWSAVELSVEQGADVLSLSLGWQHDWDPNRQVWRQTFDNVLAAGVIAAVAAGNEGDEQSSYPIPDNIRTPGDCPPPWLNPDQTLIGGISSVVCIGATTSSDEISSFSSQGPVDWSAISTYNDYPYQPEIGLIRPDVCTPGSNIKSLAYDNNTGYASGWSGTSMATPAAAGVMALMIQKHNQIEPSEICRILEETTLVLQQGKNNVTGSGRVDALAAIEEIIALPKPTNLNGTVTFETGQVDLSWDFVPVQGFEYFIIYRDGVQLGTSIQNSFIDLLPDYGIYTYQVTAMHTDGESAAAAANLQWGDAQISVTPLTLTENLQPGATSTRQITIENTGQLPLEYSISSSSESLDNTRAYCQPTANCTYSDGFTGFAMGDISNLNNGCSANGYGDFTGMSTDIQPGNSYEVSFMTGYSNQDVCLWIDFNKNEVFDDDELLLEDYNLASANQLYTTTITIPGGLGSGNTRMRIRANWQTSANDPCDEFEYGETEDYTVNVLGWLSVDNISGTIAPGESQNFDVSIDASELSFGTYYGNIHIINNDPNSLTMDVPVTLNVANTIPLSVEVTAVPEIIIAGESTQLTALPNGGSETYTYSWSSDPAGFTSSIANPQATPDETTTFSVEVNDGVDLVSGSVLVTVETPSSSQDINLIEGWNLFSSKVMPNNPDMLAIVQPLIDEGLLFKVIDENGSTVFHLPFPPPNGLWNNSIGDILQTEGYYIKLIADATLSISGTPTELPLQIPLTEGWNMISYPCDVPQDALQLVQPLIDAGLLYKVIDQQGGVVFHLPFPPPNGQWSNSIGNFEAGQGYYIKVTADATLTIDNPDDGYQAPQVKMVRHDPVFFNPIFQNNPYQPMAVIVKTSSWMEPGDEVAVFDGDICVGVKVFTNTRDEYFVIPVSMDDPETEIIDGASSGNNFSVSLWNLNGQNVYTGIDYDLVDGSNTFSPLGTAVIEINPLLTQLSEIVKPIGISLHPNPMNTDAMLEISVPKKAFATINIFDAMGSTKAEVASNMPINDEASITIQKSALHLQPGIYTLQIILSEDRDTNPVVRVMKFIVY